MEPLYVFVLQILAFLNSFYYKADINSSLVKRRKSRTIDTTESKLALNRELPQQPVVNRNYRPTNLFSKKFHRYLASFRYSIVYRF